MLFLTKPAHPESPSPGKGAVAGEKIHGLGPYLALKLVGECGTDLSAWPSAKHFTSWLCLAPSNKISGGKVLSSRTRRSSNRASALLRSAAVTVGRTETAFGSILSSLGRTYRQGQSGHGDRPEDRRTASVTSVLRPGTCFASRAFTSSTVKPRCSRISKTGIQ
jgi:Transposase IS116/IS110/IS902 family